MSTLTEHGGFRRATLMSRASLVRLLRHLNAAQLLRRPLYAVEYLYVGELQKAFQVR